MTKSCLLCNYNKFEIISSKIRDSKNHKIIKCKKCNHIQIFPVPTINEDKKFYDKNLQDKNINYFGGIKENRKKSYEDTVRRTKMIKKYLKKSDKILEIGSGHGFFIESMYNNGYNITGIEISQEKRNLAKKITKAQILDIDINQNIPKMAKFNVIVLFHVLEHIVNPIEFLKKIRNLLTKNGKIIVEVPNSDDLQLNNNQKYTEFYWQRAHIHYFNPKKLKFVFKKTGLKSEIFGIQRYSIENMISWKLTKKPQLNEPTYYLKEPYDWIDMYYKQNMEKSLTCDTIICIGKI